MLSCILFSSSVILMQWINLKVHAPWHAYVCSPGFYSLLDQEFKFPPEIFFHSSLVLCGRQAELIPILLSALYICSKYILGCIGWGLGLSYSAKPSLITPFGWLGRDKSFQLTPQVRWNDPLHCWWVIKAYYDLMNHFISPRQPD